MAFLDKGFLKVSEGALSAQELIKASLRAIGAIATGETPTAAELKDGLEAMNMMFRGWAANRLMVHSITEDTHTLTAGTGSYTIGDGGDIDTDRPTRIISAFTRGSGIDVPLEIVGESQYQNIGVKDFQSTPGWLYYNPTFSLGTIYLYPYPSSALTMYLYSLKPWTEITTLTSNTSFPGEYDRAIKYNLAIELAPEYGTEVSPAVAKMAEDALNDIFSLNASMQVQPVKLELLRLARKYEINEG